MFLIDADFAVVHEAQQRFHFLFFNIAEDNDGMLAWICLKPLTITINEHDRGFFQGTRAAAVPPPERSYLEQRSEVRTARGEDNFMRGKRMSVASNGDVDKVFLIE